MRYAYIVSNRAGITHRGRSVVAGRPWLLVLVIALAVALPLRGLFAQEAAPTDAVQDDEAVAGQDVAGTTDEPAQTNLEQPDGDAQAMPAVEADADAATVAGEETAEGVEDATQTGEIAEEIVGEGLRLNFRDSSVDVILEYLSEAAGLTIIKDVTITGRISIISRQPLDVDEAVALLNTVLKEKGYAGVRAERTLRVVTLADAKEMNIPVRLGADPEQIPANDELVTQVIPILHADATKLVENVKPLLPEYADISANADSNSLILTDTSANIKRIAEIVKGLDGHMSSVTAVRVVKMKYADASDAVKLIEEIFTGQESSSTTSNRQDRGRMFFRGRPGGEGGESSSSQQGGAPSQKVKASADTRTNSVVFTGPADTLDIVEAVLVELDATPAAELAEIKVFQLEYATASDAATLIKDVFGEQSQSQQSSNTGGFRRFFQGGGTTQESTTTSSTDAIKASADDRTNTLVVTGPPDMLKVVEGLVADLDSNPTEEQAVFVYRLKNADAANLESVLNELFSDSSTTSSGNNSSGRNRWNNTSTTVSQTANELAGEVSFVADEDSNSLLVMASSRHFERLKGILDELDAPVPEVLIKVLLAEVTHDNSIDLGTEFSVLNLNENDRGQEVFTDFNVLDSSQGVVAKIVEKDASVALRALAEVGKLDVLSRPYILASDNQEATITVGQEVPFITQSRTTDTGQTINTVSYEDIGIILTVTPHINPDGLVILDVAPEISQLTGTTVQVSDTSSLPVYAKRSASSRVGIMDGQTIVIGGLVEDTKTETIKKVPLLGDIPLLGWLFKRKEDSTAKTELLIFLTPHVALRPESLKEMSESEQKIHKIVPTAIAPGKFDEHMEGMKAGAAKKDETAPQDTAVEEEEVEEGESD